MEKIRFLQCLSKQYPTIDSAATEIINLQSILNLPKGTEHFCLIFMVNTELFLMYFATVQEQL